MARPMKLEPFAVEHLRRLKAEWELASLRASLARRDFESAVAEHCASLVAGRTFELDLEAGLVHVEADDGHQSEG